MINYYYPNPGFGYGPRYSVFLGRTDDHLGLRIAAEEKPFSNVYLDGIGHATNRAEKCPNNWVILPMHLALIDQFGADAVRVGLMLSSAAGNDLLFDESLCQQGKNFANKIWNAYRLVEGWRVVEPIPRNASPSTRLPLSGTNNLFHQALNSLIDDHFQQVQDFRCFDDACTNSFGMIFVLGFWKWSSPTMSESH